MSEAGEKARIAALESEVVRLRAALAQREEPAFGDGLREREALLSEAERIVSLGCWMWDPATDAVRWSDGMYRLLGVDPSRERPSSGAFYRSVHPDDVARVRESSPRSQDTGAHPPLDFRLVRPDGTVRHVHMEGTTLASGRLVGSLLDVTERHEIDHRLRQSQKMEAIGTLAGGIAHDFNNYLQVIFGNLDLLASARLAPLDRELALVQIREAAERSQRLTRQLLVFSRRRVAEPEVVALDQLLDQSWPIYETLVGDRIRLRRIRNGDGVRVRIDRGALEQVVLNLVVNARDAMSDGGRVIVELDVVEVLEERGALRRGRYAVLTVEDNGSGIAPEVMPRIFEPFFTTKSLGKGTGLGLATAHGIVTHAGGSIDVDSTVGKGTLVRVMLPLESAAPVSAAPPLPLEPARGRVLVVEDQPQVRMLVRRQLESAGYQVFEAEHGLDALRVLGERSDVDLVLSDVSMPRMTGPDLARRLADERPALPVILMAGMVDSNVAGISTTLLYKPFLREDLLRAVGSALLSLPSARPA